MPVETVFMVMFVWWEAPISMKVEWKCASMTSGGLSVVMAGALLMLLWSASSWVMQLLEVSTTVAHCEVNFILTSFCVTGGIPYSNAFFGAGTGPIYLDDVACTSSANQLLECSSRPILRHNCSHSTDAGVGCEGNYNIIRNLN